MQHFLSKRIPLNRMYEYRRMLPHYLKAGRAVFITFCKATAATHFHLPLSTKFCIAAFEAMATDFTFMP